MRIDDHHHELVSGSQWTTSARSVRDEPTTLHAHELIDGRIRPARPHGVSGFWHTHHVGTTSTLEIAAIEELA